MTVNGDEYATVNKPITPLTHQTHAERCQAEYADAPLCHEETTAGKLIPLTYEVEIRRQGINICCLQSFR